MTGARPGLGIGLVLAATACFASGDNLVKLTGALLPVILLLWMRYGVQAGMMAVWLARPGGVGFRTAHPKFQAGRGALLLGTSGMSFFGLQRMPAAEFTALGMLSPVVVTLLAATLLRQRVSALRWALVWAGFAGALIVIRPGSGVFGWTAVFPLAMAVSYGGFQVLTSRLAGVESPYVTQFYTGLVGLALTTPFLLAQLDAVLPAVARAAWPILGLVLALSLFATVGHLLLVFAFGHAPMATLMPFVYAQIGFALAVGWAIFGHVPDAWAWVGIGVVAACGAASAWLNARETSGGGPSAVAADTLLD